VFTAYNLPSKLFSHVTLRSWDPLSSAFPIKAWTYALQRWAFVGAARRFMRKHSSDAWVTRDPAMIDALQHVVHGPWFLELHDAPDAQPARWNRIKHTVSGYLVITHALRDKLVALGVPHNRIHVSADGFDPAEFKSLPDGSAARKALKLPSQAFVVIYTGGLYPWKGVDLVVSAWAQTPATHHLVIVGGPDGDRARIQSLVSADVKDRVHILPMMPRAESLALLPAADVGLLSSAPTSDIGRLYTSPLKQFEYLAAGLPVLASDVPSSHELLTADVARFYTPDEKGFVNAVTSLASDHAWRKQAAAYAPPFVAPYTWEARAKGMLQFIERLTPRATV
jgi:glycosyltransferase involved in cell wall biosynthesis